MTVSPRGIVAGSRYYIAVTGATNDVFDTGATNCRSIFRPVRRRRPPPVVITPPVTIPVVVAPQILAAAVFDRS